ncbi:shikimate kinase AroK [Buchnera aphidicola]|uniref:shikimate kinase AroK n=1 Tax=Buchnera aphidicola TaxID=9 RepID=UPI00094C5F25|nr:shikimate kinase AroK [Buchnera aphidicola]
MHKQKNIFLVGPMGSGKSTIGYLLSTQLNMKFYDVDQEAETRAGLSICDIFNLKGEPEFRIQEEKIIKELTGEKGIILATGGGSIMSLKSRNLLSSRGIVIYLRTTIHEQLKRVSTNKNRPLLSQNHEISKKTLSSLLEVRSPLYRDIANIIIDTSNRKSGLIISNLLYDLNEFSIFF